MTYDDPEPDDEEMVELLGVLRARHPHVRVRQRELNFEGRSVAPIYVTVPVSPKYL